MLNAFDEYQDFTDTTAVYPKNVGLAYTALEIAGEAGEYIGKVRKHLLKVVDSLPATVESTHLLAVIGRLESLEKEASFCESWKKSIRKGDVKLPDIPLPGDLERKELEKELSDVVWGLAQAARRLERKLSEIVKINEDKLKSRLERKVIVGEGDNR